MRQLIEFVGKPPIATVLIKGREQDHQGGIEVPGRRANFGRLPQDADALPRGRDVLCAGEQELQQLFGPTLLAIGHLKLIGDRRIRWILVNLRFEGGVVV